MAVWEEEYESRGWLQRVWTRRAVPPARAGQRLEHQQVAFDGSARGQAVGRSRLAVETPNRVPITARFSPGATRCTRHPARCSAGTRASAAVSRAPGPSHVYRVGGPAPGGPRKAGFNSVNSGTEVSVTSAIKGGR